MGNRQFPPASVDQVLGLLKVLKSLGGRTDIYRIDEEVEIDFDELSNAVNAAKILGLVVTEGGDVELTELGDRVLREGLEGVRDLLARRVAELSPFAEILSRLRAQGTLKLEEVVKLLCALGYCDDILVRRMLGWGVQLGVLYISSDSVMPAQETS
ncbi:AAA-associated domain-containing protein [Thermoproteus tenax]|uniref:Uncharacterized protein n=1 Tax=Thermoproteus tenax (strain ATCC 35583 / DSM 2078 / JCM 9277 / NBRC 100435 / Kra 1) TaxID=768679 RepID=G4RP12_THETK|nr:AAA-associated domain-containing protein [Thermoproteus tenax]CCC81306.1 hypothetical protein TTX_0646 [Thermoproteus tenax Kra 1]